MDDKNPYEKVPRDRTYRQHVHVRVAEEKLGRKLGKKEVVHHVDGNKTNNEPENLMVLRTRGDHTLLHAKIPTEVLVTKDGSCVVVKVQRECPNCERLFEPNNDRNVHCSLVCSMTKKKIEAEKELLTGRYPTYSELQSEVASQPMTHVGLKYGVSDNAIRKWCKSFGIELPIRQTA